MAFSSPRALAAKYLGDQAPLQRQFFAVNRNAGWEAAAGFIDGTQEYASNQASEKIDGKFSPDATISAAIEDLFSYQFQERV